jgi:excisionase family DNA binding protein
MKNTSKATGRPYLSTRQAAWILGVQQATVHRAIRHGILPGIRRRSRIVVAESDVQRLMRGGAS